MTEERPNWNEYFSELAKVVSTRATCPRAAVGAVIVRDKRVLTTGYNGAPPNMPHCLDVGCDMVDNHCLRVLHAEANAILQGALYGIPLKDASIFIYGRRAGSQKPLQPCVPCSNLMSGAGIKEIIVV